MSQLAPLWFRGGPVLTLDAKGRLTVPARWREQLAAQAPGPLVLTKDPAGCLGLYPQAAFAQLEAVLMTLPSEDAAWKRLYLGHAHELEVDSGSRILMPPELRRWAGMKEGGSVTFMGVGAYFELWDSELMERQEAQALAQGRPQALKDLVIR